MSFTDVVSSFSAVARTAPILILCMTGAAVEPGSAAPSAAIAPVTDYLNNANAASDLPATSFSSRFHYAQSSMIGGLLAGPAFQVPIPAPRASLPHNFRAPIAASGPALIGIASMYNPGNANDRDSGTMETASGERYDAEDWTAAIRTDLRDQFGGVRFGKNYQPTYALVETEEKRAIVRINDVGPLRRGRIIDLNEGTMRYFDPGLKRGVLDNFKVTPLAGQDWALGPVVDEPAVNFAGRFEGSIR